MPSRACISCCGRCVTAPPTCSPLTGPRSTRRSASRDGAAPEHFRIAMAVLDLLSEVAADAPLLVIAEDAHWLDRPTSDVLAFVARRLESDPIVLLAATRDGYPSVARRRRAAGAPARRPRPGRGGGAAGQRRRSSSPWRRATGSCARPPATRSRSSSCRSPPRARAGHADARPGAAHRAPRAGIRRPGVRSARARPACSCWSRRSTTGSA